MSAVTLIEDRGEGKRLPSPRLMAMIFILGGAAVSVAAGAYGRIHDPAGVQTVTLLFSTTLAFKAWTTTLIAGLAGFQLVSALRLYGRFPFPRRMPSWYGTLHRLSGTLAFMLTLPVAYHCLWSIGFAPDLTDPRRFVHSALGCLFYGAILTKVLTVRSERLPRWMLPAVGGTVFVALVGLWLTSSLWFFTASAVSSP